MARPRIFLSSTYFDLKNVRVSLQSFMTQMGYDPVLNEVGAISYGSKKSLDTYCNDEVQNCDILVCLIGGRFGSTSSDGYASITQNELKTALDLGKQVYIFVEASTFYEYSTYKKNRSATIDWAFADDVKIYQFIDFLYGLPINNAIFPFDNSNDIIAILREQWAGLFQRLLTESSFDGLVTAAQELNQGLTTLRQFINVSSTSVTEQVNGSESALEIIEHPVFSRLKKDLKAKYRVFFMTRNELEEWLEARSYSSVPVALLDDPGVTEWYHKRFDGQETPHPMLKIDYSIFDEEGRLKPASEIPWHDDMVRFVVYDPRGNLNIERES